ncbi:sigma-70 family RNA polymerase sigma factor [Bernardetia sp.]|uniref:sigma-70 family RNA polymerase sigma factor n=1 Tax=Bernardetia sp. TaxID=1937974 RepID=UPI0025C732C0|nr:sigma-70 family RNA polymerase sigma factor [Bernardetia sp.]
MTNIPPITQLLSAAQSGDTQAMEKLFPLVYDELVKVAHSLRVRWQANYTLNTTALVHEAYLKLSDQDNQSYVSRGHFFAVAAKAMRHILVNYAKMKTAEKRGGKEHDVDIQKVENIIPDEQVGEHILSLHEALITLENLNERQGKVVECRFFAGLSIEETADALEISPATVKRDWTVAKAYLYNQLKSGVV